MLTIDGSRGEGGGQIVRTSLALAMLRGQPVRLTNVRAGRSKPGLMRQHLTALHAAAAISQAEVDGAELRSQEVVFEPDAIRGGEFHFKVGTAGSTSLVLQTVIPALVATGQQARIVVEGGTHAMNAPPFEFLDHAYGSALRAMGVGFDLTLEACGFYPAGGGCVVAEIDASQPVEPFVLDDVEADRSVRAVVLLSSLPRHIAERELAVLRERFEAADIPLAECAIVEKQALSQGNVAFVVADSTPVGEVFTAFGRKGRPAEKVAAELADATIAYLSAGVPVGPHLADQLLVLLSAGRGGRFRTMALTSHSETMLELIPELADVEIGVERRDDGTVDVEVSR